MSYNRNELLRRLDDPKKVELVTSLDATIIAALTAPYYTDDVKEVVDTHPRAEELHAIRYIYYNHLLDWNTEVATQMSEEISDFISSESFVQYPDFFLDEAIVAAIRTEQMHNHSQTIDDYKSRWGTSADLEILGARIGEHGEVEIMVLHNPGKVDQYGMLFFDADKLDVPKEVKTGLLKRNSAISMRGRGNEIYMSIQSPNPGNYSREYKEIIIAHLGEDGIIVPIENV